MIFIVIFQDATNGEGPDLIIEMLANVNLEKDLSMIRKNGRIIVSTSFMHNKFEKSL